MEKNTQLNNIAYIYQQHYLTNCARVATRNQQGKDTNYVVICCSEHFAGVYKYPAEMTKDFEIWYNNKTPCYVIPMDKLQFVKKLDQLNPENIAYKTVKQMQRDWWKGEIKNGKAHKTDKYPGWFLK